MIGNDIVDLRAAGNVGKHADRRFIQRVFTENEGKLIAGATDPDRMLWSLWSAKESVFKIEAKLDPAAIFAHRLFMVTPNGPDLTGGLVQIANRTYPIHWSQDPSHVHAWSDPGFDPSGKAAAEFAIMVETLAGPESAAVRAMACRLLAQHGFPGCVISGRPPRVFQNDAAIAIGISLSHDGIWGAVAIAFDPPNHS